MRKIKSVEIERDADENFNNEFLKSFSYDLKLYLSRKSSYYYSKMICRIRKLFLNAQYQENNTAKISNIARAKWLIYNIPYRRAGLA